LQNGIANILGLRENSTPVSSAAPYSPWATAIFGTGQEGDAVACDQPAAKIQFFGRIYQAPRGPENKMADARRVAAFEACTWVRALLFGPE
jgi:hypothetical protein